MVATTALDERDNWWLRSVRGGSSSNVCLVGDHGIAASYGATHGWVRPRPGFLFKLAG